LTAAAELIADRPPEELGSCPCPHLLDGFRKDGLLTGDWREYITRESADAE
jgi:hypothetical protein